MEEIKVVIIDDESKMCRAIEKTLSKYSLRLQDIDDEIRFNTISFLTAEDGLKYLERGKADIILLDYKLPGISGLDFLDRVKFDEAETLVIMITAYASLETAINSIKKGAYDFIAKPFTPDDLRKTVKKASQQLLLSRRIKKLEQEKRKVRFQFISVLGHELKSPLNAVEGYLQLMKDRALGDNINAYTKMIERSLLRIDGMRKLIADMLDLTRIESGEKKREIGKYNLTDIANEAIENVKHEADRKKIEIILDSKPDLTAKCDRGEILVILNNLISNAVKYNKERGKVRVRIKKEDRTIRIEVEDTGIGISKEDQKRLFQEFVRIRNDKTKNIPGSGLGLAIVKKIAHLYNGNVIVESEPEKGSKFTVTLKEE